LLRLQTSSVGVAVIVLGHGFSWFFCAENAP
jgi:hypothetical protein